jgi:MarR family multiple antibiotic resistance transcriptional regulator
MSKSVEFTESQMTWIQLEILSGIVHRAGDLELAKIGLNLAQGMVLYCVSASPEPMTPMKLSRLIHKEPHTVSALVKRMEAKGLLKTRRDLKRKNWVRITLTSKGEEVLQRWPTVTVVPDTLTSSLSKRELETLRAITKNLQAAGLKLIRDMQLDSHAEPLFW